MSGSPLASGSWAGRAFRTLVVLLLVAFSTVAALDHASDPRALDEEGEDDGMAHVVVGLNGLVATRSEEVEIMSVTKSGVYGPHKATLQEFLDRFGGRVTAELTLTHAVAIELPREQLEALESDTTFVEYVEWDRLVYPQQTGGQSISSSNSQWANNLIGLNTANIPPAPRDQIGNDFCFRLCVVDAGVLVTHPDIPYNLGSRYIWGAEFGLGPGERWHSPVVEHGSHVAGIMIAEANNNLGIDGVIPDNANICLLVARVFNDQGQGARDSKILEGAEWCAAQGARVINMSLGAEHNGTPQARAVYNNIIDNGALIVAASGNGHATQYMYPASFDGVMSVAAVDRNLKRASFSQHNDQVDIAAPGQMIQSLASRPVVKNSNGNAYEARALDNSPTPNAAISSRIVDCGSALSNHACSNARGAICLIDRGSNTFGEKARVCQRAGGIGAIIANNENGALFAGTLGNSGITIPVVSVSRAHGNALRNTNRATISLVEPGYETLSGTSMAAPYVSGVAARIWSRRPECTNEQVKDAILGSAQNLGNSNFFGNGLVRAQEAYERLLNKPSPCGSAAQSSTGSAQGGSSGSSNNSGSNNSGNAWWGGSSWGSTWGASWLPWNRENDEEASVATSSTNGGNRRSRNLRGKSVAER